MPGNESSKEIDNSLRGKSMRRAMKKTVPNTLTPYEWEQWYAENGVPEEHKIAAPQEKSMTTSPAKKRQSPSLATRFIVDCWTLVMDSRRNPLRHLDLAGQHYFTQVLAWMWSMVFSLSFLSIYNFGVVWVAHLLVFGGAAFTVAVFKESEKALEVDAVPAGQFSHSSRCVWRLDSEA